MRIVHVFLAGEFQKMARDSECVESPEAEC